MVRNKKEEDKIVPETPITVNDVDAMENGTSSEANPKDEAPEVEDEEDESDE